MVFMPALSPDTKAALKKDKEPADGALGDQPISMCECFCEELPGRIIPKAKKYQNTNNLHSLLIPNQTQPQSGPPQTGDPGPLSNRRAQLENVGIPDLIFRGQAILRPGLRFLCEHRCLVPRKRDPLMERNYSAPRGW